MEIIPTNFDYRESQLTPRNIDNVNLIILHHIACEYATPEEIHQWHLDRGWAGIGYNFYVRKDGTVYSCRPMEYVPAHCQGYNTRSIGVAFEGNYVYEEMGETQINAGKELVAYLKATYGISDVGKHCDYQATECPGQNFPFDEIVNGSPVPPSPEPEPGDITALRYTVQRWLNSYGYSTPETGLADETTFRNIVKVYQNELNTQFGAGIEVNGVYDDDDYDASWREIGRGAKGNITKSLQAMLIWKGYELALDGDFGRRYRGNFKGLPTRYWNRGNRYFKSRYIITALHLKKYMIY